MQPGNAARRQRGHNSAWRRLILILAIVASALLGSCGTSDLSLAPVSATLKPSPAAATATLPAPAATQPTAPAYWPTHDWRSSTPEEQGVDSAQLHRALQHIEDAKINVRSITVIRNGYIVLEAVRQPFSATQPYPTFSVTKSVTGALSGIAIHEGVIKSVDQPVLSYFPDMRIAKRDASKAAITLEDVLTMRSGLRCADRDIGFAVENSSNWVQYILDMPVAVPPGQTFAYCTAGPHLLSAIVGKATGMSLADYAQSRLFGPLGIAPGDLTWDSDPQGVSIGGYGISMRTRDMAKIGLLYLHNGTWADQQIIPREWVAASTTVHSTERPGKSYGYLLWIYPNDRTPYVAAEGLGSQVIQIVRDRNMVVVMTAAIADTQGQTTRDLLQDYIVPAASSNVPLPANPAALSALRAKIADLANPVRPVAALSDIARRIAGKTFVLDKTNALNVREFSIAFAEGQSDVLVQAVSTEGATGQVSIGLDNVYRQTPGDPTWRRGWWEDDHTFVLRELDTAGIQERETRFSFTGDEVHAQAAETTLGTYAYEFKGRLK